MVVAWAVFLRPQFLGGDAGYVTIAGKSMEPGMHTGDVVVVRRQRSYRVGDVLAYRIPRGQAAAGRVVIHRVRGGSAVDGYIMRGDNRDSNDFWRPTPSDAVGKAWVRAPGLGLVGSMILSPLGLGLLAGLATMVLIGAPPKEREPSSRGLPRSARGWRERDLERRWAAIIASAARDQGAATGRHPARRGSPRCDYGRLSL